MSGLPAGPFAVTLGCTAAALLVMMAVTFGVALKVGKHSVVDTAWGIGIALVATVALVSSMGALQGGKVFASYFAAKAYEWILAEGLWAELAEAGVDALAYVVGATRTENYKGQIDGSSDAGTAAAGDVDDDDSDDDSALDIARRRLRHPSDPDEVGRHLFDVLGRGPTEFSHPDDERHAAAVLQLSRRDAVAKMSDLRLLARSCGFEVEGASRR